jgi:methyl-accepting chemotaxis protein
MADDHLLKRIDRHMERGNQLMERNNEVIEENRRVVEENRRVVEENSRVIEKTITENREFMRELLQRHEWFTQQVVGELKDLQDQTKAQTRAILNVLDRLQPSG